MKPLVAALILPLALAHPAPADTPGAAAKQLMSRYGGAFVEDLRTITNIDSGTAAPEGDRQIAEFLKARLEQLGATVEFHSNDQATHVIARFKGEGKLRLLIVAQTDTVFPRGEAAKRPFRVDAQHRAYGPGVGDGKAAVIQTLYAMRILKDLGYRQYGEIVLYFDGEEESDSKDSNAVIRKLAPQADAVLVMQTGRPKWGVVTTRKGRATYELKVTGRSGHAGNAPQSSASAVTELGLLVTKLHQLASPLPKAPLAYRRESLEQLGILDQGQFIPPNTINVGMIETPNAKLNVIPDQAVAHLEVRCFETSELTRLDRAIRDLAKQPTVSGTTVTVTGEITKSPMHKTPAVQVLVDTYRDVVKREYGTDIYEYTAGGVSEANDSAPLAPTLDALGIDTYETHTDREWIDLDTVEPRTVALVRLIQELKVRLEPLRKARATLWASRGASSTP